jgi:CRP-like cAMP-binding protein
MLKKRQFQAGETILRENDLGETAYIIQKGRVEISREVGGRKLRIAVLGPGDTIGEMSMIDDKPRSATAVALDATELTEIHQDDFYEALQTDPQATILILKVLFERLREANQRFLQLSAQGGGASPAALDEGAVEAAVAVVLEPVSDAARQALPEGPVRIERFPYRVGRVSHNPLVQNDLELRDEMPWQISRHHLAFVFEDGRVGAIDRGSTLGSSVEGTRLGGRGGVPGPLWFPESGGTLVLGNAKSPYEFRVAIEPAR